MLTALRNLLYNLSLTYWHNYQLERYYRTFELGRQWPYDRVYFGMPKGPKGFYNSRAYYRIYNRRLDDAGALVPNRVRVFFRTLRYVWRNPYVLISRKPYRHERKPMFPKRFYLAALVAVIFATILPPTQAQSAMDMSTQVATNNLIQQASGAYDTKPESRPAPKQNVVVVPAGTKVVYQSPKTNPYSVKWIRIYTDPDDKRRNKYIVRFVDRELGQVCYRGEYRNDEAWTCGPIPPGK